MALRLLGRRLLIVRLAKSHSGPSVSEFDVLLGEAVRREDAAAAKSLASRCVESGLCPSLPNVLYVLSTCAQTGDRDAVLALAKLCCDTNPKYLVRYSGFRHFVAEAVWARGNVEEALRLFGEVYEENAYMRRRVRLTLKHLVRDAIGERSEASLVNVVAFGEELAKKYGDYFVLIHVWEACLLSDWHHDQKMSLDLLDRHRGLLDSITARIPYVVGLLLSRHRTEPVYKILETLLRHEMRPHYPYVVLALLDYQINRGDLMSCVEIVRWSLENDVALPSLKQDVLMDLLMKYDLKPSGSRKKPESSSPRFKF